MFVFERIRTDCTCYGSCECAEEAASDFVGEEATGRTA
jgi:hypothetical protein